jgi:SpoVK/Ycf46/Vps4 family AAA+-type ATPase
LLYGSPGNGKSTLIKLAAEQLGVKFVSINAALLGNEFVNSIKESLLKKIEPHLNEPCVIGIDEIDAILRESKSIIDPKADVAQQVWQIFDELSERPNIIVFGTTNNIKGMPQALQDRFSKYIIEIPHADLSVKKDILAFYLKGFPNECNDKFLSSFVENCKELSAREIENLVNGAISQACLRKPAALFVTKKDMKDSLADILKNKQTMKANENLNLQTNSDWKLIALLALNLIGQQLLENSRSSHY